MAISYETDVKPLFRELDRRSMLRRMAPNNARAILDEVEHGRMPCDNPWPQKWVDRFRQWIADGKLA